MRRLTLVATLLATAALAPPAAASFGVADVNTGLPGDPTVPAFPGQKAIWAGTCDLSSGSTASGGIGSAPATRSHCLDLGVSPGGEFGRDVPWRAGEEPAWRLDPVTSAGAHPDGTVAFWFNYDPASVKVDGSVKDVIVRLPPGVVGNPQAVAECPAIAAQAVPPACPAASQVGISTLGFPKDPLVGFEASEFQTKAVYGMEARRTVTAEFTIGHVATLFNVPITARGRTNGDYGIDTLALLIPQFTPLGGQAFTFWGVPWASEHDRFRIDGVDSQHGLEDHLTGFPSSVQRPYEPAWGPIRPFFTNPTECSGKRLPVGVDLDSWEDPVSAGGPLLTSTVETDVLTGCEELEFDPSIALKPTVSIADSPAGLDVHLSTPQNNDPPQEALGNPNLPFDSADDTGAPAYWRTAAGRATAHLKDTVVRLPRGTSFNPAAANGLEGCTTEQIGLTATHPKVTFDNEPIACPDTSRIGTLEIDSPLLPDPLFGGVYVAPQHDNPFPGTLTAIYLVAQDEERGLSVKLPGRVDLDPLTGQISTTFVDNPQLPVDEFTLHLKTGPRAPINTPPVCGRFENSAEMIPWSFPSSGPVSTFRDPFDVTAMPNGLGCVNEPEDRVFGPGFSAGGSSTQAGEYTTFALDVTREDGNQELSALDLDMPAGLTADLSETPFCPEEAIAAIARRTGLEETQAPSCPPGSLIGAVDSLAGAGPLPLPTSGRLYLAGPYDPDEAGSGPRAPLSAVAVVPAIAGGIPGRPAFDLGNVVVRSAVYVDPDDAGVHISSAPLPYLVGGVPLRVRRISVSIEKPAFMLNPTNCAPAAVGGRIGGAGDPYDSRDDSSASASSRFQVGGCERLGFKPNLKLRLIGGTRRADNPKLRAVLTPKPGDANIARTAVTLPHSAFLDQSHINTICSRVLYAANQCPPGSIYGYAKAWTPLLAQPLEGPVYLRASSNPLPDLVAALRGTVDLDVVGRVDSVNESLRTTFDLVPDAPVSRFVLNLRGGKRGLIQLSRNVCAGKRDRATARFLAQNGLARNFRPVVGSGCKKSKSRRPSR